METGKTIDFVASMSRFIKITTVMVYLALAGLMVAVWLQNGRGQSLPEKEFPLIIPALVIGILFVTYLFHPSGYRVGDHGVEVLRPLGPLLIPFGEIERVSAPVDYRDVRGIGIFRSGGFHGVFGVFWSKKLGKYILYATNERKLVEIVRRGKPRYFISPDETARFLAAMEEFSRERSLGIVVDRGRV